MITEEVILEKRKEFCFLWESEVSNKVVVAARGTGKTVAALQFAVEKLLMGQPNSRTVFFSATLKQARLTVEPIMRLITSRYPSGFYQYNVSEHKYKFFVGPYDERELVLLSYENPESKRGLHPDIIVLDECASMPSSMFGNIIAPMLKNGKGILLAIGTAQGHNKFYELYQRGMSKEFPDWESYRIRASDCQILDAEYLWSQKNSLTMAEYAQEYECDFEANVLVGSVYGEFINRFTNDNIKDSYIWNPKLPVWVSWDLGYADYTSLWFFQVVDDVVTFIDYFEDNGKDTSYYADLLLKKPYNYAKMILPWDGGRNDMRGLPISEQLSNYGFKSEVLRNSSEAEGIDEARKLLKVCRFNKEGCKIGLGHLKGFKYRIDRQTGLKTNSTVHDEHSHGADSFRYAAMSREIWQGFQKRNILNLTRQDYDILY